MPFQLKLSSINQLCFSITKNIYKVPSNGGGGERRKKKTNTRNLLYSMRMNLASRARSCPPSWPLALPEDKSAAQVVPWSLKMALQHIEANVKYYSQGEYIHSHLRSSYK